MERQKTIHQFRRSVESSSNSERILPQLEEFYKKCEDHMTDLVEYVTSLNFRLTFGQKKLRLVIKTDDSLYEQYIRQLLSYWDEDIPYYLPKKPEPNLISNKKMKQAMRKMGKMNASKMKQVMNMSNPEMLEQVGETEQSEVMRDMAERLRDNPYAQKIAKKLDKQSET